MTTDASWIASMPERYDTCLGPALFAPYARHLAALAEAWAPARVLEVAAGTGIVTAALRGALPDAEIVATDLNLPMVEWARARVPGVTWQQADAQELPFPPGSFDLVVCAFGAMFFPDRPAAFGQMREVLAPGARALLSIWDTVERSDLSASLLPCLEVLFPDDPPTFIVRTPHGYTDPERIEADLRQGGFTELLIEHVVLRGAPTSVPTYVEGLCLGSPLRFELAQRGDPAEIAVRLTALLQERLGHDPVEGALAAFVVTATRD